MKTSVQLEYENAIMWEQLVEKDDLIKSLKNNQIESGQPHSQELINNLNLKLAKKNVLINKI